MYDPAAEGRHAAIRDNIAAAQAEERERLNNTPKIKPKGISDEQLNFYEGIRDQDGWETLEMTIRDDHPRRAEEIMAYLKNY